MLKQMLCTLLLSVVVLGVASAASEAGRGKPPGSTATSTDSDAGSASSDPETDSPQSGDDPTPPAKDKRRDHRDRDKHHPRRTPDVTGPLRARVEQADRALQKLLSAKAQALQLLHGAPSHRDHGAAASSAKTADPATGGPDPRDSSDDAPAADP